MLRVPQPDGCDLVVDTFPDGDPHVARALKQEGVWEPLETQVIRDILRPGDTAVDVGTHLGYYTMVMARCVGPRGRVVAFEPEPMAAALTQRNLVLNGLNNVEFRQRALSSQAGHARLYLSTKNRGDHRLEAGGEARESLRVQVSTLDAELGERPIRLIKTDCQGEEGRIWLGGSGIWSRRTLPAVCLEFWPYGLAFTTRNSTAFLQDLARTPLRWRLIREGYGITSIPNLLSDWPARYRLTEATKGFATLFGVPP